MATKSFLEFLDSPDIRRYHRNTAFTPAEQAVLISMSVKQSVTEKMAALRQLAAQYSSAEFGADRVRHTFPDFREGVLDYAARMQEALEKRYEPDAVVFSVICTEAGYSAEKPAYFSNFKEAYSYLNEQHAEYMQPFSAEIHRIPLENARTQVEYIYYWNSEHVLYDMQLRECASSLDLDTCFVAVPLPFAEGDLVKCPDRFGNVTYGVIHGLWDEADDERHRKCGDISDMILNLEGYTADKTHALGGFFHRICDVFSLWLSACTAEELPEDQKYLLLIQDVIQGRMDALQLLESYGTNQLQSTMRFFHANELGGG